MSDCKPEVFYGVEYCENAPKPYHAYITVDGVKRELGHFLTTEEAALAYDNAERLLERDEYNFEGGPDNLFT